MSSYWGGNSGTGIIFSHSEFEQMMKIYVQKNPSEQDAVNKVFEDCSVEDLVFVKSKYAGELTTEQYENADENANEMVTCINVLDDSFTDGVTMWPFYRKDGRMNITERKPSGEVEYPDCYHPVWDDPAKVCYVCWSEKNMSSSLAFIEKPYAGYEEFVQEFKDKFSGYLPDDFDWNAHLGSISFASYG